MLVTITFAGNEQQTTVRIVHESLTTDRSQMLHQQGWSDSLDALAQLLTLEV
jgi:uncharacterized protein YndB with AHSA1/START domain